MTLEELLKHDEARIDDMEKYFATVGLKHVNKKDLNRIIEKFGLIVFKLYCFSEVYKIVQENETSKNMRRWTYLIGIMTILYTVLTFIMLFR